MTGIPSRDDILAWIRDNPGKSGKRDIARAFGIKGAQRADLKRLLRDMQADGDISRDRKAFRSADALPPVAVMRVIGPDRDGDMLAEPQSWDGEAETPQAVIVAKKGDPALAAGDRVLARIAVNADAPPAYEARIIRKIGGGPARILGLFRTGAEGGRVVPVDKRTDREWAVPANETADAVDGELVEAEKIDQKRVHGLPRARIVARLGDPTAPKSFSLIAIHEHGIPDHFPADVTEEAGAAKPMPLGNRTDLRDLPLVTIDPSDARDHDDAIAALPDPDPKNEGGHVLWVAIADVAAYVRPGSAIDHEARRRGNSTYFPDRVVPMLPDHLSGDLCSLHENVDRPCMALEIKLSAEGDKIGHRFVRGLMKSQASLSYEEAQDAANGDPNPRTLPLMASVIQPLWNAYAALTAARKRRQPLDLDLPERKIVLSDEGKVTSVNFRDRFDAHRLVEEFMVLANVCAAETLEDKRTPLLYRVHEEPNPEKLEALREVAEGFGLTLAKGQVLKTAHLNRLLAAASETDHAEAMNISVLRSMTQAYYAPENLGHFGLALRRYAHFTSPIRRYSDLIVHRALIAAHGWGDDGLTPRDIEMLEETAKLISDTERRSMTAERDTNDRYLSAFLAERIGSEFSGSVAGVARFGVFVKLEETGADGLVPVSSLGREYFRYDEDRQTLTGEDSGLALGLATRVTVRIAEAEPITGGLIFELVSIDGGRVPRAKARRGKGPVRRKLNASRRKKRTARKR